MFRKKIFYVGVPTKYVFMYMDIMGIVIIVVYILDALITIIYK